MNTFAVMLLLFYKSRMLSRSFIAIALSVIILMAGFAFLSPQTAEPSAKVGIIFENSDQRLYQSCCNLLNLQEIDFIRYHDELSLCHDVMRGKLHCGYKLDSKAEIPIKVFETDGSMLTPVLDELVFSAWFQAHMLNTAPSLYGSEYKELISSEIERLSLQSRPLAVDITVNTMTAENQSESASFEPVLYSVFIAAVLVSAAFCALLSPAAEKDAVKLLTVGAVSKAKLEAAAFFSQMLCFITLPTAFELITSPLSLGCGFSLAAKAVCALLLSALSAAVFCFLSRVRPGTSVLFFGIIWGGVSIAFSGAFISTELFGIFEPVKYFSPSWLLLQLMSALSAL